MVQNCNYLFYSYISENEYIIGSIVLLVLLGWGLFRQMQGRVEHILVGIIVGASAINLIERSLTGCVNDYFNFFGIFHFNLQDVAISVGVLTLVYLGVIKCCMPLNSNE